MRKIIIAIVLMTTLLASVSCSGGKGAKAEEKAAHLRTCVLAAAEFNLTADVRADYGERVFEFTFTYAGSAEDALITINAPEEIAGVTARVVNGGAELRWDGAAVDTGEMPKGLSPAGMMPLLIAEWRGGYMTKYSFETIGKRHLLVIETEIDDTVTQTTVFNADTYMPERAEIAENGRVVLIAEFAAESTYS